jgi:hypothetical protein
MESNSNFLQIKLAQFTVQEVRDRFNTDVPKAADFGFKVGIFVLAVFMAITFIKFFLNRGSSNE